MFEKVGKEGNNKGDIEEDNDRFLNKMVNTISKTKEFQSKYSCNDNGLNKDNKGLDDCSPRHMNDLSK